MDNMVFDGGGFRWFLMRTIPDSQIRLDLHTTCAHCTLGYFFLNTVITFLLSTVLTGLCYPVHCFIFRD